MTSTALCACGEEPAVTTNAWTGQPVGAHCAARPNVPTAPLTVIDVIDKLREAVTPAEDPRDQEPALFRIAELMVFQQRRIVELEAAVAKLTDEEPM